MLFPAVGIDQLLGLLKIIKSMTGKIDIMDLNAELDVDVDFLPHVIDVAEMLGLVKASGGDVELTEVGSKIVEKPLREFQLYLKEKLVAIPPFRDLVELVKTKDAAPLEEALRLLISMGYDEESARRIIDWAVFAQLVEIDDGDKLRLA